MRRRALVGSLVASALLLCSPAAFAGQQAAAEGGAWSPPLTPWGHPDLQGTWSNASTTPLERPADLAGQEVLTDEERAARAPLARLSDDRPVGDPVGFYNDYWLEQGDLSTRTSLIVEPRGRQASRGVGGGAADAGHADELGQCDCRPALQLVGGFQRA